MVKFGWWTSASFGTRNRRHSLAWDLLSGRQDSLSYQPPESRNHHPERSPSTARRVSPRSEPRLRARNGHRRFEMRRRVVMLCLEVMRRSLLGGGEEEAPSLQQHRNPPVQTLQTRERERSRESLFCPPSSRASQRSFRALPFAYGPASSRPEAEFQLTTSGHRERLCLRTSCLLPACTPKNRSC